MHAIDHRLKRWPAFECYAEAGHVPSDKKPFENALRPIARAAASRINHPEQVRSSATLYALSLLLRMEVSVNAIGVCPFQIVGIP